MIKTVVAKMNDQFGNKWQDWIFGSGGAVFTIFLLPTVFSASKPPLISSIPTWIFLWTFVFAHYSKGDYKGAFWNFACGLVWLILALQQLV